MNLICSDCDGTPSELLSETVDYCDPSLLLLDEVSGCCIFACHGWENWHASSVVIPSGHLLESTCDLLA